MTRLSYDCALVPDKGTDGLRPVARAPWNRPWFRATNAAQAKTGLNSITDIDSTFS
ncbi:MAG TPA: hypothetical protein VII56_06895 [Rhizomicrobium sp.]